MTVIAAASWQVVHDRPNIGQPDAFPLTSLAIHVRMQSRQFVAVRAYGISMPQPASAWQTAAPPPAPVTPGVTRAFLSRSWKCTLESVSRADHF
jgi:hypothetical protein